MLARLDDTELKASIRRQEASIVTRQKQVLEAQAWLELENDQRRRLQLLEIRSAATKEDVTAASFRVQAAKSRVETLKSREIEAKHQLEMLDRQKLSYLCKAPIGGTVIEMFHVAGEVVREGELIARIESSSQCIKIYVGFDNASGIDSFRFALHGKPLELCQVSRDVQIDGSRVVHLKLGFQTMPVGTIVPISIVSRQVLNDPLAMP